MAFTRLGRSRGEFTYFDLMSANHFAPLCVALRPDRRDGVDDGNDEALSMSVEEAMETLEAVGIEVGANISLCSC